MNPKYLLGGLLVSSLFLASCEKKNTPETSSSAADKPAAVVPEAPAVPDTAVALELAGKSHIMKDGEYVETKIKNVDYYLLYFTASW